MRMKEVIISCIRLDIFDRNFRIFDVIRTVVKNISARSLSLSLSFSYAVYAQNYKYMYLLIESEQTFKRNASILWAYFCINNEFVV